MTSLLPVVGDVLSTELPVTAPHHLSIPGLLPQSLCSLSPSKAARQHWCIPDHTSGFLKLSWPLDLSGNLIKSELVSRL